MEESLLRETRARKRTGGGLPGREREVGPPRRKEEAGDGSKSQFRPSAGELRRHKRGTALSGGKCGMVGCKLTLVPRLGEEVGVRLIERT